MSVNEVVMQTRESRITDNPADSAVVLFSGGIDSLGCLQWAVDKFQIVTALYIDVGVSYSDLEISVVRDIIKLHRLRRLHVADMRFLGQRVGNIGHIPLRNTFFLEYASLFADNIVFGMLKGEMSEDKNPKYIRRMETLLNSQVVENLYNTTRRRIRIHTPFANKTKTDVVRYLRIQGCQRDLEKTIGCINATTPMKACGHCISCFNRWVALENNGWGELDKYPETWPKVNHPAVWGLDQLRSNVGRAARHASWWNKRQWFMDVHKAYKIALEKGIVHESPWEVLFK